MKPRISVLMFAAAITLLLSLEFGKTILARAITTSRVAVPPTLSYQGYLAYNGGLPLNGEFDITFHLFAQAAGGAALWSETQPAVPVKNGFFSVYLGSIRPLAADDFGGATRYLELEVDTGAGVISMPRQALSSVPYAFQAQQAANADLLDGLTSSQFQARITENCALGSVIRAINADGSVECSPISLLTRSPIDRIGDVGDYSAIAIGADGLALISYLDKTNHDLKVAHCKDIACTSATITTIDSSGEVGYGTSIVVGPNGLGLISYLNRTTQRLKVAYCQNIACTNAITSNLDSILMDSDPVSNPYQYQTSLAIGSDGLGLITYTSVDIVATDAVSYELFYELKVAHCVNAACTSATITTLETAATGNGRYGSLVIGSNGLGLIVYHGYNDKVVKAARCTNLDCTSGVKVVVDNNVLTHNNIAVVIGADGLPLISYVKNLSASQNPLTFAHCADFTCQNSSKTSHYLDNYYLFSMQLGSNGLVVMSLFDYSNQEHNILLCHTLDCSSKSIYVLDATNLPASLFGGYTNARSAIAIGTDGLPLVSYYDNYNGELVVLHCSTLHCKP